MQKGEVARKKDLLEKRKRKSLIKGQSLAGTEISEKAVSSITSSQQPPPVAENPLVSAADKTDSVDKSPKSSQPAKAQKRETMEEVFAKIAAMKVNTEESKKLRKLGRELKNAQQDKKSHNCIGVEQRFPGNCQEKEGSYGGQGD